MTAKDVAPSESFSLSLSAPLKKLSFSRPDREPMEKAAKKRAFKSPFYIYPA
jgi:hypothetical protein